MMTVMSRACCGERVRDNAAAMAACCVQVLQDKYEGLLGSQIQDDFAAYADVAFKT